MNINEQRHLAYQTFHCNLQSNVTLIFVGLFIYFLGGWEKVWGHTYQCWRLVQTLIQGLFWLCLNPEVLKTE